MTLKELKQLEELKLRAKEFNELHYSGDDLEAYPKITYMTDSKWGFVASIHNLHNNSFAPVRLLQMLEDAIEFAESLNEEME